jgi:hypothetical protein
MNIPRSIPGLVFRLAKTTPLTYEEGDNNLKALRDAILAISDSLVSTGGGRLVIGNEPPIGERENVVWIPADYSKISVWNAGSSSWERLDDPALYAVSTGTATAYEVALGPSFSSYAEMLGSIVVMKPHVNSTDASATLEVASVGSPAPITKYGAAPIIADDIKAGQISLLAYNGTSFELLNPRSTTGQDGYVVAQGNPTVNALSDTSTELMTVQLTKPSNTEWVHIEIFITLQLEGGGVGGQVSTVQNIKFKIGADELTSLVTMAPNGIANNNDDYVQYNAVAMGLPIGTSSYVEQNTLNISVYGEKANAAHLVDDIAERQIIAKGIYR